MRKLQTAFVLTTAVLGLAALPATAQLKGSTPPAWVDPSTAVPIGSLGGSVSALSPNCGSGNGCVWTQTDFNGSKRTYGPGDAGTLIGLASYDRSSANRFNARYMAFYRGNGSFLSCINGGNNDRNLYAETDLLVIGGPGSNC